MSLFRKKETPVTPGSTPVTWETMHKFDGSVFNGRGWDYRDKPLVTRIEELEELCSRHNEQITLLANRDLLSNERFWRLVEHLGIKEGFEKKD